MHSTLWIGGVAILGACGLPRRAAARAAAWRIALCGGIVTSALASLGVVPHYGPAWLLEAEAASPAVPADDGALRAGALRTPIAVEEVALNPAAAAVPAADAAPEAGSAYRRWAMLLVPAWLAGAAVMLARLAAAGLRLRARRLAGSPAVDAWWPTTVERISRRIGLVRPVDVLISPADFGPACCGWRRGRIFVPETLAECLSETELEALAAHELAHLRRADPAWTIAAQVISGAACLQPLNYYASRRMQVEAEYAADELAAQALAGGAVLARCLVRFRAWAAEFGPAPRPVVAGAVGMASFRSTLGRRVERLVALDTSTRAAASSPVRRGLGVVGLVALLIVLPGLAPRAVGVSPATDSNNSHPEDSMHRSALLTTLSASLLFAPGDTVTAAEKEKPATAAQESASGEKFPEVLRGFLGRIRGTIVDKDPEKGAVTVKVTEVQRVWKGSTAKDPEAAVGKTFVIKGVHSRFLDVLIVLDKGDSIDLGARNVGDELQFPGELLKKSDPNEKFEKTPTPTGTPVKKAETSAKRSESSATGADAPKAAGPIPQGMAGFRGMFRGRVVAKDPEKGTVTVAVDEIMKTWPKNQAKDPKEAVGKELPVTGVFGKFLDVLIQVEKGDRIEIEAFHNSGNAVLTFPGEWLKKVD
jgi:hypothetical protein